MEYDIKIGNYSLAMLERVEIDRNVELLSDTATITLPASAYNKALNIEDKIKRGDKVTIDLGYDDKDNLVNEFTGYLESIKTDQGSLKLNIEDNIWLYRVDLKDVVLKDITVTKLLEYVNKEVSAYYPDQDPLSLSCDYDFKYDKFTISNATGYDVLKKVQEEAKPNVYMKDRVLQVHPQYIEIFGKAIFDYSINIEKDALLYKDKNERKLQVVVEYTGGDGKIKKYISGTTGGDKLTFKLNGVTDITSIKNRAEQELTRRVFTGYEGSFTGWLIPFVDAGYEVLVRDADYTFKNGWYYVLGVKIDFSSQGGSRTTKLGKKLRDE